jgi:GntR family transcriptional regulator
MQCRDLVIKETTQIVDRAGIIPIHVQIFNYLNNAIKSGRIPPGSRLPSIRELAESLGIATNTVARAYRELGGKNLINSKSGRGSIVVESQRITDKVQINEKESLIKIIRPIALKARLLGYEWNDIQDAIEESIQLIKAPVYIGLVTLSHKMAPYYISLLEEGLKKPNISIMPIELNDLSDETVTDFKAINSVKVVVAVADSYSTTRHLLEPHGFKVIPLLTDLNIETHTKLAELTWNKDIALVCEEARHNYIMWLIGIYCNPAHIFWVSEKFSGNEKQIFSQISTIVYDGYLSTEIVTRLPKDKQIIELKYIINSQSLNCVREFIFS